MSASYRVQAEIPEAFAPLFDPCRYKVYYGGRGGAKSWNFARALLILGAQNPLRVLCAREFQNSISDSVHKLLSDQVTALSLDAFYEVKQAEIRGQNGTEFIFIGLRRNIGNMKSYEGIDVCWVEEAKDVSKTSWETLIPTIRKPGSEIWISFNPELDTDETFLRFVRRPPKESVVRKVTWRDNPWFPDVLKRERDDLLERDPRAYRNVWEGECRVALEGAIFASELEAAASTGRVGSVPVDSTKPVHTVWDLGQADSTAIWFVQMVGREYHLIDFYQAHGEKIAHYVKVLRERGYAYGDTWVPHDAAKDVQAAETSILSQLRSHNLRARLVPMVSVAQRIEAGRAIFSRCRFDEIRCAEGMTSLKSYRYELKLDGLSFAKQPLHDWSSHAADAFTYLAVAVREVPQGEAQGTAASDYAALDGSGPQPSRVRFVRPYDDWAPDRQSNDQPHDTLG